ncbi:MAG TPA: prephenate dehydrogenase/arogenate dehydrogenase family protein [Acidimicrobiia bacterium]|jgi:prephenate dehydrogenase|nr:prephenate dehydrogenase/arogenate dehydrogenase family protein [Acidimicrobiia bacterium]
MRIGILGTGLIGTAMGLGWQAAGHDVIGWDPDPAALRTAAERGALVAGTSRNAVAEDVDVLVLAAPPGVVIATVSELDTHALVVDVAGVKEPVAAASRLARYVGTHPMAGREVSGPEAATASLFRGAAWVVVPGTASAADLATVEHLITSLGARPVQMSAASHDIAVAAISHLPQLLASTLMNEAADRTDALELVAGSFRDLTRVAASDPGNWVDVLAANRGPLLEVLEEFLDRLRSLTDAVAAGDRVAVADVLGRAQHERLTLGPQTVGVRIALADEPGELARVGRAFEHAGVDVRDLQLRHAPYGGGGVLTVSVRSGDEQAMRTAMQNEGLLLAE